MKNKKSLGTYLLILAGVLALINIISESFFFRLDFTADKRFTLSKASKDILKSLNEPVTITAYFSEDLPPDIAKTRSDFKDLLVEYSSVSGGNVLYEFINPNEDEESEQKAMQSGIQPVLINSREKDQAIQKKAYLGALVQMGEQQDIIPFLQPGAAMEYTLSSSIKKLSIVDKPVIGFVQGHGEPALSSMQQASAALNIMYKAEPVTMNDTSNNLLKYNTIAIIAPKDSFPPSHFRQIDEYLASGENIFLAVNRVDGNLSNAQGSTVSTGLETWLANKGITLENNFVIDASCVSVSVPQRFGNMTISTQIGFPYIPIANTFEDHPVTKGLEAVVLQFVSSITFTGDTSITFTPVVKSSDKSGTQTSPTWFNVMKQWTNQDFPLKKLTLGAVITGRLSGAQSSKMVLIADGNFPINGEGREFMQLQPDNVNLLVNAVDWLSDDTGLIELRTKGITSRPIEQLEDATKVMLKITNLLLPVIIIIIYGIYRVLHNKNIRVKRMEEGYV
ncbi:MAG: Gldg family protein [Bacteroidia bacterium]|nr:Gldg family protein [Bacteroidia bacterium]